MAFLLASASSACSSSRPNATANASQSNLDDEGARAASSQMAALVDAARDQASGKSPGGRCYAAVARDIDTVGYGAIPAQPAARRGTLPAVPDAFGRYAYQFAEFMDGIDAETGRSNANELGIVKLPIDDPHDAPAGSIVVVRAGAPGTSNPVAGDISVAAGGGVFYNDGEMSYGGAQDFPPGNDFVLGVYVPADAACVTDADCNGGASGTAHVCAAAQRVCIVGCHSDDDCPAGQRCAATEPHWSCAAVE